MVITISNDHLLSVTPFPVICLLWLLFPSLTSCTELEQSVLLSIWQLKPLLLHKWYGNTVTISISTDHLHSVTPFTIICMFLPVFPNLISCTELKPSVLLGIWQLKPLLLHKRYSETVVITISNDHLHSVTPFTVICMFWPVFPSLNSCTESEQSVLLGIWLVKPLLFHKN